MIGPPEPILPESSIAETYGNGGSEWFHHWGSLEVPNRSERSEMKGIPTTRSFVQQVLDSTLCPIPYPSQTEIGIIQWICCEFRECTLQTLYEANIPPNTCRFLSCCGNVSTIKLVTGCYRMLQDTQTKHHERIQANGTWTLFAYIAYIAFKSSSRPRECRFCGK